MFIENMDVTEVQTTYPDLDTEGLKDLKDLINEMEEFYLMGTTHNKINRIVESICSKDDYSPRYVTRILHQFMFVRTSHFTHKTQHWRS